MREDGFGPITERGKVKAQTLTKYTQSHLESFNTFPTKRTKLTIREYNYVQHSHSSNLKITGMYHSQIQLSLAYLNDFSHNMILK